MLELLLLRFRASGIIISFEILIREKRIGNNIVNNGYNVLINCGYFLPNWKLISSG